jgi:hypothetical protein
VIVSIGSSLKLGINEVIARIENRK